MNCSTTVSPLSTTTEVDTRGLNCPIPVLKARRAAKTLTRGCTMLVRCTDPMAKIDIPHFARTDHHGVISSGEENGELWFLLRIGGA
ncbi:sulfurtransferase TusA family protein [Mesorhizobium sp. M1399]|uniref:sulfurtransferase TusA family protein n=1 Tax=Mesorhizobium sp. M1399 TaxID=2957096 RepID=UPI003335614B